MERNWLFLVCAAILGLLFVFFVDGATHAERVGACRTTCRAQALIPTWKLGCWLFEPIGEEG